MLLAGEHLANHLLGTLGSVYSTINSLVLVFLVGHVRVVHRKRCSPSYELLQVKCSLHGVNCRF